MKDKVNGNNNIEDLFRKEFENFEADPGSNAWSNIQQQLSPVSSPAGNPGSAASSGAAGGSSLITSIVVGSIGLAAVAAYFVFNSIADQPKENKNHPSEVHQTPVETISNPKEADKELNVIEEESIEAKAPAENVTSSDKNNVPSEKPITEQLSEESSTSTNSDKSTAKDVSNNSASIQSELDKILGPETSSTTETPKQESSQNVSPQTATQNDEEAALEERRKEASTPPEIETNDASSEKSVDWKVSIDNVFTPNQDNTNDVFFISDPDLQYVEVQIFNQAGKLVHQWVGKYGFWEGSLPDGSLAPEGMYVYVAILEKHGQRKVQRGSLTLKR